MVGSTANVCTIQKSLSFSRMMESQSTALSSSSPMGPSITSLSPRAQAHQHAMPTSVRPTISKGGQASPSTADSPCMDHAVVEQLPSAAPPTRSSMRGAGICLEVLRSFPDFPILGVCLGHQALAHVHGGSVTKAPEPVHGRLSELCHSGHALMAGIPSGAGMGFEVVRWARIPLAHAKPMDSDSGQGFINIQHHSDDLDSDGVEPQALRNRRALVLLGRYHSLVVDAPSLPSCLEAIAWTCGAHHAVHLDKDAAAAALCLPVGCIGSGSSTVGVSARELEGRSSSPAHSTTELVMALAHRSQPHFGVQFHPESISTKYGAQLLRNFSCITRAARGGLTVPR